MIELEEAKQEELKSIAEMADIIWRHYYPAIIPMHQIEYMLGSIYNISSLKKQSLEGQVFLFIKDGNNNEGFISFSKKTDDSFFIHKFYILPELHKKGLGSKVMDQLKSRFRKMSEGRNFEIRLTVNRQNFKAVNFYFKHGFVIESVMDFDIGSGYFMNDFVMLFRE